MGDVNEDDIDEDIILPTSPISTFIKNENFCFETSEDEVSDKKKSSYASNAFSVMENIFYFVTCGMRDWREILVPSFIYFEFNILKKLLNHLKHDRVLIPEDESFLINYEIGSCASELSPCIVFEKVYKISFLLLSFLIFEHLGLSPFKQNDECVFEISTFIASIICCCVTFLLFFTLLNFFEFVVYYFMYSFISQSIHSTESLVSVLKKCIKVIQEAELIARGFTSTSVTGVVERLELATNLPITSPKRQHPELRKNVFKWQKQIFINFRNNSLTFIKNKQFGPELDFSENSLSSFNLKDFGGLLNYDICQEDEFQELLKITDNFSVSSLKTMNYLMCFQISECYKYLYLIIAFSLKDSPHFSFKRIKYFYYFYSSFRLISSEITHLINHVSETHDFYNILELSQNNKDEIDQFSTLNKSNIESDIHNMLLHAKATLRKIVSVEEYIKNNKISNKSSKDDLKDIEILLKAVKSESNVLLECLNEYNDMLYILIYGREDSKPNVTSSISENLVIQKDLPKCDSEVNIEDEVFEGVIPKFALKTEDVNEERFDNEKNLQPKEVSCLMQELRNVLVIKADEHRLRERKALAKKIGEDVRLEGPDPEVAENIDASAEVKQSHRSTNENSLSQRINISRENTSFINTDPVVATCISQCSSFRSESEGLEDDGHKISHKNFTYCPLKNDSFASSIAALAAHRQQMVDVPTEVFYGDSNNSDQELD